METQLKEESEQEFQDRLTTLNNETYRHLKSQLGDLIMPQREIFVDGSITPNLARIIDSFDKERGCLILVNPILVSLEKMVDYQIFQRMNPSATPDDFLKSILTHEYGHLIECNEQPSNREKYNLPSRINTPESIKTTLISISEAFAFWFTDTFTDFKTFNPFILREYSSRASPKFIYDLYQAYQAINKIELVKNKRKIVEGLLR